MNSIWDNPPPPGTEDDQTFTAVVKTEELSPRPSESRQKSPQYVVEHEKKSSRVKRRSRSKSYDRYEKRRRSRSRSRSKYRSRRSRSRSRRRRKYSRSRSRSTSRTRTKHRREKRRHSRHRSRHSSRSRYSRVSRSRSRSKSRSYKSHRQRRSSKDHSDYDEKPTIENDTLVDVKMEEEEEAEDVKCAFKNDGSFLEMFKKMQEEKKAQEEAQKAEAEKQKALPAFGKRRGGRVLKTGMVQKTKPQDNEESVHDPWSVYMKEVKKYKEACCDDDSKTRLLVK